MQMFSFQKMLREIPKNKFQVLPRHGVKNVLSNHTRCNCITSYNLDPEYNPIRFNSIQFTKVAVDPNKAKSNRPRLFFPLQMVRHQDFNMDPCPWNIVSEIGVGFAMGSIGGSVWHGFKGYRNAPRGSRWPGALAAIKARAPILGGNFAVWTGLFYSFECVLHDLRPRDDLWNPVIAGAATGAILAGRSGPKVMLLSGFFGGVILGAIEGFILLSGKLMGSNFDPQPLQNA